MSNNSTSKKNEERKWGKWIKIIVLLFLIFSFFSLVFWLIWSLVGLPKTKEDNGRINFVFLGIGGGEQKPPDLTDTILFISFSKKTGKTFILSIPRDIWLDSLKAKINTAYHYGGFDLVRSSVQEILGQPAHYIFVLDFEGFKKIVDFFGGIDIYVDRAFDDYKYPITGKENDNCNGDKELKCRYEHLHFDKGWEKMDGERALKYIRSRNAEGEEGTDFARNLRQQKFLLALKDKLLSPKVFLSPQKMFGLVKLLPSLIKTDLKQEEYFNFGLSFLRFNAKKVVGEQLNDFLYHPTKHPSGQWVLLPKGNNWEKVKWFIKENLS